MEHLVLLVSSWEVYCEDVSRQAVQKISSKSNLRFSSLSERMQRDTVKSAGLAFKDNQDPLTTRIFSLTDRNWCQLIQEDLEDFIRDFNTPKFDRPKGKTLDDLFRKVNGFQASKSLTEFFSEDHFCSGLDEIVTIRGEVAHKATLSADDRLSPDALSNYCSRFLEAAGAIDFIINRDFRAKLGFAPWQVTKPIKESIRECCRP